MEIIDEITNEMNFYLSSEQINHWKIESGKLYIEYNNKETELILSEYFNDNDNFNRLKRDIGRVIKYDLYEQ